MASEFFLDVRDALVYLLANAGTLAGSRVRLGRRIPIENPYAVNLTTEDTLPMIVVSLERVIYEDTGKRGRRTQFTRRAQFQLDCYVQHDFQGAQAANLLPDEYLATQLDLFASQVAEAIIFYNRFRSDDPSVPVDLRLRGNVEIYPESTNKFEFPGDNSTVIGVISVTVEAYYEQDRTFEATTDLEELFSEVQTGPDVVDPVKKAIEIIY